MSAIYKFSRNRVKRLYTGGAGIDLMRGDKPQVGNFPEDWIASCVEGNTREFVAKGHGLSKVDIAGKEVLFSELLASNPIQLLGQQHCDKFGAVPGVLCKLLDSAIRLPIQVHPTGTDAKKYFDASCGKTEAWIILSCCSDAYLYLGFNHNLDVAEFRRESVAGIYHNSLDMFHKIKVKPGDVVIVYGGLPHAIGEGITMVEVMEPSDLTINPEIKCGEKSIEYEKRFAKLSPDDALDIFDYTTYTTDEIRNKCFPVPKKIMPGFYQLIDRTKVGFFGVNKLLLDGSFDLPLSEKSFRVAIMIEGTASINNEIELHAGESAFLPYNLEKCNFQGQGTIIFILPPFI